MKQHYTTLSIRVSELLLLILSNIATICANFAFRTMMLCVSLYCNLIMAKLDISSVNGVSIVTIFCSPG